MGTQRAHMDCTAALRLVNALKRHTKQGRREEKSIFLNVWHQLMGLIALPGTEAAQRKKRKQKDRNELRALL